VPPRRPDLLAPALRDLLGDGQRRRRYGAAGRARAVATYQWRQVVGATEQVYVEVALARLALGAAGPAHDRGPRSTPFYSRSQP